MDLRASNRVQSWARHFQLYRGKLRWLISSDRTNTVSEPVTTQAAVCEQVARYRIWLARTRQRTESPAYQQKIRDYVAEASRPKPEVGGWFIRPFAPFRPELSARQILTRGQSLVLVLALLISAGFTVFYPVQFAVFLLALITLFYSINLTVSIILSARILNHSVEVVVDDAVVNALADAPWPCYTILCPLYHETEVVCQFANAMQTLNYPTDRLQILFLTEEDDNATREAIKALNLPPHFAIVTVPYGKPRTKPRACNYGLLKATGDYVVIYDAEDIPDPLQLKKAVLVFANHGPELGCVQAKLNFYNSTQNVLTRWFTAEYSTWFEMTLPGLQAAKLALPLGGTSNHFPAELLRTLGAWDAFNVTEDCDLGLRLAHCGMTTVVLDSTTYEEANSNPKNWIRQRSRWVKGYIQTYLVHMRNPLRYLQPSRWCLFFSLQLIVGGRTAMLLVNPITWLMLGIYIFFRPVVENAYHILFPRPILYLSAMCLVFGNLMYVYTHLMGCLRGGRHGLIKWAVLMPLYWAMASWAAYVGLRQLITNPYYWEKTFHGLHLIPSTRRRN